MDYKILESNILFNHPHGDYVISVAIESSPSYWKSYYAQLSILSERSLEDVAGGGNVLSEHRALDLFPSCKISQELGRIKYEG